MHRTTGRNVLCTSLISSSLLEASREVIRMPAQRDVEGGAWGNLLCLHLLDYGVVIFWRGDISRL